MIGSSKEVLKPDWLVLSVLNTQPFRIENKNLQPLSLRLKKSNEFSFIDYEAICISKVIMTIETYFIYLEGKEFYSS
jgi:hypothetical protein